MKGGGSREVVDGRLVLAAMQHGPRAVTVTGLRLGIEINYVARSMVKGELAAWKRD